MLLYLGMFRASLLTSCSLSTDGFSGRRGRPGKEVRRRYGSFHAERQDQRVPGTFKLVLRFTEEYPNKPPTVKFTSRIFHPNGMQELYLLSASLCFRSI